METVRVERVAKVIRDHQVNESGAWQHRSLVEQLHLWADRFGADFDLRIPTPVIAITPLRINTLANYKPGRSDIGARTTITFNERWIGRRPFSATLATLAHELVHGYEEYHVLRGGMGYHSQAWQRKMEEIGIIANARGHHIDTLPHFSAYLRRYDLADDLHATHADDFHGTHIGKRPSTPPTKSRQLPLWLCGCPKHLLRGRSGNPVRAIYLNATCDDCGRKYRRVE